MRQHSDEDYDDGLLPLLEDSFDDDSSAHLSRAQIRRNRIVFGASVFAILIVIIVAIWGIGKVLSLGGKQAATDYTGDGKGPVVQVVIGDGDSMSTIGNTLKSKDVVKTASAFTNAVSANPNASKIGPGYYNLKTQMSGAAAVSALLDPKNRADVKFVVIDGATVSQVFASLESKAKIPKADLEALRTDPSSLDLPPACQGKLEGCLYPATYDLPPGTTAADALGMFVDRFKQALDNTNLSAGAKARNLSDAQMLTIASIIQAEVKYPDEYNKVAAVIYNRLAADMPLQMDASLEYALPERKKILTAEDMKFDSPYNLSLNKGLPPGPIDNPNEAAMKAALAPDTSDKWLYFAVIDTDGHTGFAKTYDEFKATILPKCVAAGACSQEAVQ